MKAVVFRHRCGDLQVKFNTDLFFLSVVWPQVPEKCRECDELRPMPEGEGFCCIADGVKDVLFTVEEMRQFVIRKWQHEQEMEGLAATAKAEREGS